MKAGSIYHVSDVNVLRLRGEGPPTEKKNILHASSYNKQQVFHFETSVLAMDRHCLMFVVLVRSLLFPQSTKVDIDVTHMINNSYAFTLHDCILQGIKTGGWEGLGKRLRKNNYFDHLFVSDHIANEIDQNCFAQIPA